MLGTPMSQTAICTYSMYHPSGLIMQIQEQADPLSAVALRLNQGFRLEPPTAEEIEAWKIIAASYETTKISHVVYGEWMPKDKDKLSRAVWFYTPWGKENFGSNMTIYLNNDYDVEQFEKGSGLKVADLPVLKNNAGPVRSSPQFDEYAVPCDFTVTRHKEEYGEIDPKTKKRSMKWILDSYGGVVTNTGERPEPEFDWHSIFGEAGKAGIAGDALLAHLGVKFQGDYKGTEQEARNGLAEMIELKKQKPATAKSGKAAAPAPAKPATNGNGKGKSEPAKPAQPPFEGPYVGDAEWATEAELKDLEAQALRVFGTPLSGFKLERPVAQYPTRQQAWKALAIFAVEKRMPMATDKIKRVDEPGKVYIEFVSVYPLRWYGKRQELAELIGVPEVVGFEGELTLPFDVIVNWSHKGSYLQADSFVSPAVDDDFALAGAALPDLDDDNDMTLPPP